MSEYSDEPMRSKRDPLHAEPEGASLLPDANIFSFNSVSVRPGPARSEGTDLVPITRPTHNIVFSSLVRDDTDIAGFVAYGIYKQNKRDWCVAFEQEHRRPPVESEIKSYILGESTERRLATYRNLATQLLQAREPDGRARPAAAVSPKSTEPAALRSAARSDRRPGSRMVAAMPPQTKKPLWALFAYLLFMVALVVGIAWIARYGASFLGLR